MLKIILVTEINFNCSVVAISGKSIHINCKVQKGSENCDQ